MEYSICLLVLLFFDVAAIGNICCWFWKMKRDGFRFCYVAPIMRLLMDLTMIFLIISAQIYYVFIEDRTMIMLVIMLFCVFVLPPRRYVFWGEQGIYIGKIYFTLEEQLEGQVMKDYLLHNGRAKVYMIQIKDKRSEQVLLAEKKLETIWREHKL